MEPTWELEFKDAVSASPPVVPPGLATTNQLSTFGVDLSQTKALGGGFSGAYVFLTKLRSARAGSMYERVVGSRPSIDRSKPYMIKVYLNAVTSETRIHNDRPWREVYTQAKMTPVVQRSARRTGFTPQIDMAVMPWASVEPLFSPDTVSTLETHKTLTKPEWVLLSIFGSAKTTSRSEELNNITPDFIEKNKGTWQRADMLPIGLQAWATYEMMTQTLGGNACHWDLHPGNIFVDPETPFRRGGEIKLLSTVKTNCKVALARLRHRHENHDQTRKLIREYRQFQTLDRLDRVLTSYAAELGTKTNDANVLALKTLLTSTVQPLEVARWLRVTLIDFDLTTSACFPELNVDHKNKLKAVTETTILKTKMSMLTERTINFLGAWVGMGATIRWMGFLSSTATSSPRTYDHMHLLTYVALGCAVQLSDAYNINIAPLFVWAGGQLTKLIEAKSVVESLTDLASKMMSRFWSEMWSYLTSKARLAFKMVVREARYMLLGRNTVSLVAAAVSTLLPIPIAGLLQKAEAFERAYGELSTKMYSRTKRFLSQDTLGIKANIGLGNDLPLPIRFDTVERLGASVVSAINRFVTLPAALQVVLPATKRPLSVLASVASQRWSVKIKDAVANVVGDGQTWLSIRIRELKIKQAAYDAMTLVVDAELTGKIFEDILRGRIVEVVIQKLLSLALYALLRIKIKDAGVTFSISGKMVRIKVTNLLKQPPDKVILGSYAPCSPLGVSEMGIVNDSFDCVAQTRDAVLFFNAESDRQAQLELFDTVAMAKPIVDVKVVSDQIEVPVAHLTLFEFVRMSPFWSRQYFDLFRNETGPKIYRLSVENSDTLKSKYISYRITSRGRAETGSVKLLPDDDGVLQAFVVPAQPHKYNVKFEVTGNAPKGFVAQVDTLVELATAANESTLAAAKGVGLALLPSIWRNAIDKVAVESLVSHVTVSVNQLPGYAIQAARAHQVKQMAARFQTFAVAQAGMSVNQLERVVFAFRVGKTLYECFNAALAASNVPVSAATQIQAYLIQQAAELAGLPLTNQSLLSLPEVEPLVDQILNVATVDSFTIKVVNALATQAKLYDQRAATNLPKIGTFGFGRMYLLLNELAELEPTDEERNAIIQTIETPPDSVTLWFSSGTVSLSGFSDLAL
ncbi:MAG: hypothetical protein ACPGR8_11795 [Limisphaerales bacterium]